MFCELIDKVWYIHTSMGDQVHAIWWGHYFVCLIDIDANRKILESIIKPVSGLAEAFATSAIFSILYNISGTYDNILEYSTCEYFAHTII